MKVLDWICQVEVNYGSEERPMWWAMPPEDTSDILKAVDWETGKHPYEWDQRKEGRNRGSMLAGARRTSFNRYELNFRTKTRKM